MSINLVRDGSILLKQLGRMNQSDSLPRSDAAVSMTTAPKHPEPYLSIPAQVLVQDNCRVHCGMVRKENKLKKWQDRYLVLHKGCLYYYKDSTNKKAQGQFSLSGYRLSTAPEKMKFDWTFKLTHIQPEKRAYFFAAHSEKELNDWLAKIQEDMNEYCEARPCYSSNSDSGSSYESTEENNEEKYDYPLVNPPDFGQMKRMFLQDAGVHPITSVHPITTEGDATYCCPPEFFDPTFKPALMGQLPSRPLSRKVTSSISFHQQKSAIVSPGGKASVDVSMILKSEAYHSGAVFNQAALNVAEILKQAPKPTVRKRSEAAMASPPAIHKPAPVAKPRIKTTVSTSSLSSSAECLSTEEMYLVLSNDPVVEPFSRQSTLQRMRGDGDSFKVKDNETTKQAISVLLPSTALRLDYTRTDAIPLLIGYEGAYMIHSSSKGDIKQALSVCIGDKVRHFLIFCNNDGFALDPKGLRFMSIESMLQHFTVKPLPNQDRARLRVPYN